jgi:hypothetical protein
MRIGTRLRWSPRRSVRPRAARTGFYGLPMGGFACASKGLVVDRDQGGAVHEVSRSPAPRLDHRAPVPDYGYVRRWNSPMWWRVPTDELRRCGRRSCRRAQRWRRRRGAGTLLASCRAADEDDVDAPSRRRTAAEPMKLPLSPDDAVARARVLPVSLGDKVREGSRSFYRTARGAPTWTSADVFTLRGEGLPGVALSGEMTRIPVGDREEGDQAARADGDDDKLKAVKSLERRDFVDVDEEVEIAGKAYMMTRRTVTWCARST